MSTVFYNRIAVSGRRADVLQFRTDARRRLSRSQRDELKLSAIAFSFEKLFRLHPRLRYPSVQIPCDGAHYFAEAGRINASREYTTATFTLEVKNVQIHEMLLPLSRCYPDVCFVNGELCLDDGSILSVFTRRGRQSQWDLPEARSDVHWENAAKIHGVSSMEDAYSDDDIRNEAQQAALSEAIDHWDIRVKRALRRA